MSLSVSSNYLTLGGALAINQELVIKGKYMKLTPAIIAVALLIGCTNQAQTGQNAPNVLGKHYYTDLYRWNQSAGLSHSFLGRGINMGNYLESPSYEGEWNNNAKIMLADFERIKAAGFASVRIPVRWNAHALDVPPYSIEKAFLNRVKVVVDQAMASDLKVVINTHHYNELFYEKGRFSHHRERLNALWSQVAQAFPLEQYSEDQLVFELLNEPHAEVDSKRWNLLINDLTTLIWDDLASGQNNATGQRKLMIGTAEWGGPFALPQLVLPKSVNADNTIITVHFYEPFKFTHQGAEWVDGADKWTGTRWYGSEKEKKTLYGFLDAVSKWNGKPNRGFEINIGEFGVYSKSSKPEDQTAWTAFIAREAESRGFSWHYWEYSAGFGAYDKSAQSWREPIIRGLIPSESK